VADVDPSVDNAGSTWLITGNDAVQRISVTGWAPAGSAVVVVLGGKAVAATAGNNGRWEVDFEGSTLPADGTWRASVTVTDPSGEVTHLAGPRAIIDVTPPDLDLTEGTESVGHAFDSADRADGVEIGGTSEPGAKITVTVDGVTGATATVWAGADGHWEVTFPATTFPRGDYEQPITVTAEDAFGNAVTTHDAVVIDAHGCGCSHIAIDKVTADNTVNAVEDQAGVTLSGSAMAGATVSLVLQLDGGETLEATTTANAAGVWSARLAKDLLPDGEYGATLIATAKGANGVEVRDVHEFRVDTLVNTAEIHADTVTGDGVVNAAELLGGFILTGKTEAGATLVEVHFEGVRRTATVAADGSWSVTFGPGEIEGGAFTSAVTVRAEDAAGNVRIETAMITVDSIGPEAAHVSGALHGADGVLGVGTMGGEGDLEISLIGADGSHASLDTTGCEHPLAGQMHFFDEPLPDGSALVIGSMDDAGNRTDTLVVLGDDGSTQLDLSRMDLNGFQIAEIDLNFAPEANLVITEAQLRDLSGSTDALVVHGDAQDTVTAIGAQATGENVQIEGNTYHVYTLGDAGATLIVGEDVNVHTSVI